jgi:DNA-binding response OmpR family regulator
LCCALDTGGLSRASSALHTFQFILDAGIKSMSARVLIVEDDPATRSGLTELLANAGYQAYALATFEEGLRALRSETPDLLIADVRLGAFNGLQLLVSSPRRIPAIMITGFADPVLEADARQHGADYVLKPVAPAALLDLVRRRLADVRESRFEAPRRWERKLVTGGLAARIDDQPARILDVSYGGLRFEIPRTEERALPTSLSIQLLSSDLSMRADLVWQTARGEQAWLCGAAVSQTSPAAARQWRGLVDAVS